MIDGLQVLINLTGCDKSRWQWMIDLIICHSSRRQPEVISFYALLACSHAFLYL